MTVAGTVTGEGAPWSPEQVREAVRVLGGRWVPAVLAALADGPTRRADLREAVGSSDKVLTETLQRLVDDGLVTRAYTPGVPAHAEYALTERARAAWPALAAMHRWAADAPRVDNAGGRAGGPGQDTFRPDGI